MFLCIYLLFHYHLLQSVGDYIYYRSLLLKPNQVQLSLDHQISSVSSESLLQGDSDDSLSGGGSGSAGLNMACSQVEQSAPNTTQSPDPAAPLDGAAGSETVSSDAPGTKLHACMVK